MKREAKKLSHNELTRHYVDLFTRHVILQSLFDELRTIASSDYKKLQELTNSPLKENEPQLKSDESPEQL